MVSLGLFKLFIEKYKEVSYLKPVGQQYKTIDNEKIDKDALLFSNVYRLKDNLKDMSPVAVYKGYTSEFIKKPNIDDNVKKILTAEKNLQKKSNFTLIEGTGHAGVGSTFNLSNADVAKLCKSKVIIVSIGGIGKCIDEIMLNKSVFDAKGVEIAGVIINKIQKDKYNKITPLLKKGLDYHGIPLLGTIPYENQLTKSLIIEIIENLNAKLLSGEEGIYNKIETVVIGAMLPHDALNYFTKNTLLIIPANREGLIMTALFASSISKSSYSISGIIFTGGIKPHPKIIELIKHTNIPILFVKEDSYKIATKINSMLVKVRSLEKDKIIKIQNLTQKHIDFDRINEIIND